MGEVSEEEMIMEIKKTEMNKDELMVKWERFLPRMALRVLLVEADDSTRQIITALLRKANYRVTAVSDGLKAWGILNGRPQNIDLILTEVDLPAISGFALLSLVMEHEACKNIPVIMMSSHDSVSIVYKCMLKGAVDYLVKPLRRNELRNLWQHVWRRQSASIGGNVSQDESVGQQKIEATSENDAASNHSSGNMPCTQRKKEHIEKGSDAQSSCTKMDFEAESADNMEDVQVLSRQLWSKSLPSDIKMQNHEASTSDGHKSLMHENKARGLEVAACKDSFTRANLDVEPESQTRDVTLTSETCDVLANSSREAIDFMGAFDNHNSSPDNGTSTLDYSPELDLSLRRSHPSGSDNQIAEQKITLMHSNASAFTRYMNKPFSTLTGVSNQQIEFGTDYENNRSNIINTCTSDTPVATPSTQRSISSLATGQYKQSELETSCPQQTICPVPLPGKGKRPKNLGSGYGSVPPVLTKQSSLSPLPSTSSANQQDPTFRVNPMHCSSVENSNCPQLNDRNGENAICSTNQTMQKLDQRFDSLDDRGHISPATDQSATSSFCNGNINRLNSIGYGGSACGSNSNVEQVTTVGRTAAESKNEEGLFSSSGNSNSHRSIQREAALNKFRLKRKDRCYDKKVRYESRKKLAEQRPRVKGQFVRQVNTDHPQTESENQYGNSV